MEWKIITGGGILQDVVCMATGSSAIENLLRPGGNPIGVPGAHATIRVIAGATLDDADNLFNNYLKTAQSSSGRRTQERSFNYQTGEQWGCEM